MKKLIILVAATLLLALPSLMTAYSLESSARLLSDEHRKQIETRLENELRSQSQIALISQEIFKHFSYFLIQTEQIYTNLTWGAFAESADEAFENFIQTTGLAYLLPMEASISYRQRGQHQLHFSGTRKVSANKISDLSALMFKFIDMAFYNDPPQGAIEQLQKQLTDVGLIFNLGFLKSSGDRVKANQLIVRDTESTRMLLTLRSKKDYLMNVLIDLSRAEIRTAARKAVLMWKDTNAGIVFFGGSKAIKPVFSAWFNEHPGLEKKVIEATGREKPGTSRMELGPWIVLFTPFDPKIPWQVAIVTPMPKLPEQPGLKILLCIFAIAGCAVWKLMVDHVLFDRKVRLSLRNFIILVFTLVSMVPFTSGLYLANEYVVANFKIQRNKAASDLSAELEDLDLSTYSNFRNSVNFVRGMNSIEQIASFTGLAVSTDYPELVASMSEKVLQQRKIPCYPEIWLTATDRQLIEVEYRHNQKDFNIFPTSDAFANEVFSPRFKHILNEQLKSGRDTKNEKIDEIRFEDIKAEIIDSIMLNLFGEQSYFSLQEDPGTLLRLQSFFDENAILSLPITLADQAKYIFTYVFSSETIRRHFPVNRLSDDLAKPVLVTLYGNNEFLTADPGSFHTLSQKFPGLMGLAKQSLLTGARLVMQDVSASGSPIFETLPARYSNFILCGQRNTRSLDSISQELTATAVRYFVLMVLAALFMALLSSLYFTIPIRQLTEATRKIIAEDYSVRINERHPDEFAAAAVAFNKMAGGLAEGELLKNFVSESVREMTAGSEDEQAQIIDATVLFSSIKDFKSLQKKLTPTELFSIMQTHLTAAVEKAVNLGGEIDKMIEDKVMVVFPHSKEKSAEETAAAALTCARYIQHHLWLSHKLPVAIGVNSGEVVSGIMGATNVRLARTVVGDTVNLAARLASAASDLNHGGIVVSGASAKLAAGAGVFKKLPINQVKGKTHAIEAFLAEFSQPEQI